MKPHDIPPSSDPTGKEEAQLRIAVIDDEHQWLKVFKRMFHNSTYLTETYDDPQKFVNTVTANPNRYAGIICDIKMPRMDGHQVYETVKNNRETKHIPFLIVSGVLTQNYNLSRVQGLAYVSKLDDNLRGKVFEELIEVIENWPKVRDYLRSQDEKEKNQLEMKNTYLQFENPFFAKMFGYFYY